MGVICKKNRNLFSSEMYSINEIIIQHCRKKCLAGLLSGKDRVRELFNIVKKLSWGPLWEKIPIVFKTLFHCSLCTVICKFPKKRIDEKSASYWINAFIIFFLKNLLFKCISLFSFQKIYREKNFDRSCKCYLIQKMHAKSVSKKIRFDEICWPWIYCYELDFESNLPSTKIKEWFLRLNDCS